MQAPHPPMPNATWPPLRWDIFCRVVDNLGDVGVCWRLAADLADRGHRVRLVIDDATALRWMAPQGHAGVQVLPWPQDKVDCSAWASQVDVAIEAFACDPPARYAQALAPRTAPGVGTAPPALWINLEYLSAEPYVERSHGLPSRPLGGALKWFYFPGFNTRTGGLIRAQDLLENQQAFDRDSWLLQQHLSLQPGERLVSLFCYHTTTLPDLLQTLAGTPCLVLLAGPQAQSLLAAGTPPLPSGMRVQAMPWLSQPGFDRMLWACDVNVVRGEDSLVRALWAGKPFIWQAYPQHDGAHHAKVQALLTQMQADADLRALWAAWNGMAVPAQPARLPAWAAWTAQTLRWRDSLLTQPSLCDQLQAFVHTRLQAGASTDD